MKARRRQMASGPSASGASVAASAAYGIGGGGRRQLGLGGD